MEKVWHKSKKFLAFLIMESVLGGLAFYTIFHLDSVGWPMATLLMTVVMNMGFIAVAIESSSSRRAAQRDA